MIESAQAPLPIEPDIARYEVSEDGITWRPYDPRRDHDRPLHKRIEFAPPTDD